MSFAELARISVARHGLIRLKSGELAYIARRFDRVLQKKSVLKLPQEDLCQVLGLLTEDKYSGSIEKIGRAIRNHCTNVGYDLTVLFDVVLFSFLMGNSDMHLKNFSLLEKEGQGYGLSPAYDLVPTALVNEMDTEELALTLNAKKRKIKYNDFLMAYENCGLSKKVLDKTLELFIYARFEMCDVIQRSFVSDAFKQKYVSLINQRYKQLGLL